MLANGGQSVGEARNLVEVVGDAKVKKLGLPKLGADGMSTCLLLRCEAHVLSRPHIPRGGNEEDKQATRHLL